MKLENPNLFIEGAFINNEIFTTKDALEVYNPSTNQLLGNIANCTKDDVKKAINSCQNAFEKYRKLTAKTRAKLLMNWHDLILQNQEDLAAILTSEQGKPLAEARSEIAYAASFVSWFASEATKIRGDVILSNKENQKIITQYQALGVVACITPWNFPSAMITRKAAAALAAGCSVILKASELTPFSALALAYLAKEAGFEEGVFNVITGAPKEIGEEFCENSLIRKISFTGSTRVGKLLYQNCASDLKKLSLELGGSAPFIIFDDANLDKAITGLMHAKFRNGGQACTCVNRIFVQEKIYPKFLEKFVEEVKKLKVGDGFDDSSNMGPMINDLAIEKIENLIADALNKGTKCEIGGQKIKEKFFAPTVLTNISSEMKIANEEIFGSVAAIQKFKTINEVIKKANDTIYGLGSYLYSENLSTIWQVSDELNFGMVAINECSFATEVAPFAGIKHSGFGVEGSHLGILEFCNLKTLHISY
jgi:succinate-semialdehyde dehydrogenase/glutarate-semialdehyde dehydrogenase